MDVGGLDGWRFDEAEAGSVRDFFIGILKSGQPYLAAGLFEILELASKGDRHPLQLLQRRQNGITPEECAILYAEFVQERLFIRIACETVERAERIMCRDAPEEGTILN